MKIEITVSPETVEAIGLLDRNYRGYFNEDNSPALFSPRNRSKLMALLGEGIIYDDRINYKYTRMGQNIAEAVKLKLISES